MQMSAPIAASSPLDDAAELAHVVGAGLPGLHGEDDLSRGASLGLVEVPAPVDALVRALLGLRWPCADQAEGPTLELERVRRGERCRVGHRNRLPDDAVRLLDPVAVGMAQPVPNQVDRQVRDVRTGLGEYPGGTVVDPTGPPSPTMSAGIAGPDKVSRGCDFGDFEDWCDEVARRSYFQAALGGYYIHGFRLVRVSR